MDRLKYELPVLEKQKSMRFPKEILEYNRRYIVCKQCSNCHGCR